MKPFYFFLLITIILVSCVGGRQNNNSDDNEEICFRNFEQIKEDGKLIVTTLYSSTSYFQYRMQPMGYEYEMIKDYAESNNLSLEIKVAPSSERMYEMLDSGIVDVIAYPVFVSNNLKDKYTYCGKEEQSSQVLIQRTDKNKKILKNVTELIGKTVYVKDNSRFLTRMKNLNSELGGDIDIKIVNNDSISLEDLISMVSRGEIEYTVADENVARLNKTYHWNINTNLKISFVQRSSWIVKKENSDLANSINSWASDNNRKRSFSRIIKRYYELGKQDLSVPTKIPKGHISPYDKFFRKYSGKIGWDWKLIASISYQESHFNPNLVSWAGAEGLMGIMPNTAKALGVTPHELREPETAISTGVECLMRFYDGFPEIEDEEEKIKFTIASYNAGIGHIYDARRLAEKYGKNPNIWEHNVADFVRLKSEPEYYNDPVCKHGYLRGSETFNYVKEILERFEEYKSLRKDKV